MLLVQESTVRMPLTNQLPLNLYIRLAFKTVSLLRYTGLIHHPLHHPARALLLVTLPTLRISVVTAETHSFLEARNKKRDFSADRKLGHPTQKRKDGGKLCYIFSFECGAVLCPTEEKHIIIEQGPRKNSGQVERLMYA